MLFSYWPSLHHIPSCIPEFTHLPSYQILGRECPVQRILVTVLSTSRIKGHLWTTKNSSACSWVPWTGLQWFGCKEGKTFILQPLHGTFSVSFQSFPQRKGNWRTTSHPEAPRDPGTKSCSWICFKVPYLCSGKWMEWTGAQGLLSPRIELGSANRIGLLRWENVPWLQDWSICFTSFISTKCLRKLWTPSRELLVGTDAAGPNQIKRHGEREKQRREKLCHFWCNPNHFMAQCPSCAKLQPNSLPLRELTPSHIPLEWVHLSCWATGDGGVYPRSTATRLHSTLYIPSTHKMFLWEKRRRPSTLEYHYPLPLVPSALEQLCSAKILGPETDYRSRSSNHGSRKGFSHHGMAHPQDCQESAEIPQLCKILPEIYAPLPPHSHPCLRRDSCACHGTQQLRRNQVTQGSIHHSSCTKTSWSLKAFLCGGGHLWI